MDERTQEEICAALRDELDSYKSKYAMQRDYISQRESEFASLKSQLEDSRERAEVELLDAKNDLIRLKLAYDKLEEEMLGNIQKQCVKNVQLQMDVEEEKERYAVLKREYESKVLDIVPSDDSIHLASQVKELQRSLDQLTHDYFKMRDEHNQAKLALRRTEHEKDILAAKVEQLVKELDEKQLEVGKVQELMTDMSVSLNTSGISENVGLSPAAGDRSSINMTLERSAVFLGILDEWEKGNPDVPLGRRSLSGMSEASSPLPDDGSK